MNRPTVRTTLSIALMLSALAGLVYAANQDPTFAGATGGISSQDDIFYPRANGHIHLGASCQNPRDPSAITLWPIAGEPKTPNFTYEPSSGFCRGLANADPAFVTARYDAVNGGSGWSAVDASFYNLTTLNGPFSEQYMIDHGGLGGCPSWSESISDPCPGASLLVTDGAAGPNVMAETRPYMNVQGCPQPGNSIRLNIGNAAGGSTCTLLLGTSAAGAPFFATASCQLHFVPIAATGFVMPGSGIVDGFVALPGSVPTGTMGVFYAQAFFQDAGAPNGYSSTNAIKITVN